MIHRPLATYRVQFTPAFTFRHAEAIVPYLCELGISDLYASPIFKARAGTEHGYDVIDHNELNPELGDREALSRLSLALARSGMAWIQDFVPNHMAFDSANHKLMDILENGETSRYAGFFDIAWNHPYESIKGKVLAPFLGSFYGECLEKGELTLGYGESGFSVNYYAMKFPVRIETYATILTYNFPELRAQLGRDHPDMIKLLGVFYVLRNLAQETGRERSDQITFAKRMLWELYSQNETIRNFITSATIAFNGTPGNPESFNLLDTLLADQLYRFAFWKVATAEINYRRFFNINDLICITVENEQVFNDIHTLLFSLFGENVISGVRLDHIDGLYDPTAYLNRLRERLPDAYISVEKILDLDEELPPYWRIQGTTGYNFLNYVNGIFCERGSEHKIEKIYYDFSGVRTSYRNIVADKKRIIIGRHMAGEIEQLAHLIKTNSSKDRYGRDITLYGLRRALVEVLAFFPVYRTYVNREHFTEQDRAYITRAIRRAQEVLPAYIYELKFVERFLLLQMAEGMQTEERAQWLHFIMRFQQLTGPLMAKGFEDTTMYVYNKLVSLNEVGGNPNKFGISPVEFHYFNKKRITQWHLAMNATATHDTKRGEDIRARINVLSELPDEWERHIRAWHTWNLSYKRSIDKEDAPDKNDEYFLYQTLVGAFPFEETPSPEFAGRIRNYIIKAIKEAKTHTGWISPNEEYENAYAGFITAILEPTGQSQFFQDFKLFQKKVAFYGIFNSLAQTLLKITSPGVPDFYQGCELWDLSLVDPDNRRPVDYTLRRTLLANMQETEARDGKLAMILDVLSHREDARVKLLTIRDALRARRDYREVFEDGEYIPLKVNGERRENIFAFARRREAQWIVVAAPRLIASLVSENELPIGEGVWRDTAVELPEDAPNAWRHVYTEKTLRSAAGLVAAEMFHDFPLGLMVGE